MAVLTFSVVVCALIWVMDALRGQRLALEGEKQALADKDRLLRSETGLKEQLQKDKRTLEETVEQRNEAYTKADKDRQLAVNASTEAETARRAEEYKAYVAGIAAAAAKIDEGAFDVARQVLDDCAPELRNWEWGRLRHLCHLYHRRIDVEASAPLDGVALSPDGSRVAVASWDRHAWVREFATGRVLAAFEHGALYVHAVAWSPDGRYLATGSSDPHGYLQLWDVDAAVAGRETEPLRLAGHTEPVVSVRFSPDGRWLLSTSYDKRARLWDVAEPRHPREAFVFAAHDWWVWDGAFAPGFNPEDAQADNRIVTVDQDGRAIVWKLRASTRPDAPANAVEFGQDRIFEEHDGPIYSVDFARVDGVAWVATGGLDGRVLLWRPEDLPAYGVETVFNRDRAKLVRYREFTGHTDAVQSVAFSKDATMLVSGGRDNALWIWPVLDEGRRMRLSGHFNEVREAQFTDDGQQVVSVGRDEQILVWSTTESEGLRVLQERRLQGHGDAVLSAQFSPNGAQVVTASRDRTARVWDASSAALLAELREGHEFLVANAVFFPGSQRLATAAADNSVRLWDLTRGTETLRLTDTGFSGVLGLSRDGARLVTGGPVNTARLWQLDRAAREPDYAPRTLETHQARVMAAACSPVADVAATADANGLIALWDISNGQLLWSHRNHNQRVNALCFMPDGSQLLAASSDHTVGRIDVATGELTGRLIIGAPATAVAVTADSTRIVTVNDLPIRNELAASRLAEWDPDNAAAPRAAVDLPFRVHSLALTPDGRRALAACSDATVRFLPLGSNRFDPAAAPEIGMLGAGGNALAAAALSPDATRLVTLSGADVRLFDAAIRDAGPDDARMTLRPHGAVASARFSPTGDAVVTGSWDRSARIWDVRTQAATLNMEELHKGYINSAAYSPDGTKLLTAGEDGTARVWNLMAEHGNAGREPVHVLRHSGSVNAAVFSPEGRRILTVSSDRTARLWDAENGALLGAPFQVPDWRWPILCAAFSSDGTRCIIGGEDNEACVWDAESRNVVARLVGHTAAVTSVALSNDDTRAFTASRDRTAKAWDVSEKGLEYSAGSGVRDLLTLTGHQGELTSIAFDPHHSRLLTGSRDGSAILWIADPWVTAGAASVPPATAGTEPARRK
jgi:WD40 repeat protein